MESAFLAGVWGHSKATSSEPTAARTRQSIEHTEDRLERALLTMEAIWTLVRDHTELTDEDLLERIVEIDFTDGVLDGKARRPAMECPGCSKRIPRRFARCMFCGADVEHDPFT